MSKSCFDKADDALRKAAIDAALKAKKFGHGLIVTDAKGRVQEVDPDELLGREGLEADREVPRQIAK